MADMTTTYLYAPKEVIDALVKADYQVEEGSGVLVDFNQIVPAPETLFAEDANGETTIPLYGVTTWDAWGKRYWGVSWNADNAERRSDTTLYFDTPWDSPLPVLKKLSEMFPDEVIYSCEAGATDLYKNKEYSIVAGTATRVEIPADNTNAGRAWANRIRNRELD